MKKIASKAGLFFLVAYWPTISQAQSEFQKSLKISYETGNMLSNGTEWGDRVKNSVNHEALDLKVGWRKISNTTYNYLYRYPTFGLGFNAVLPYNAEIGRPLALYGYMEVPFSIKSLERKFDFGYFTQFGFGFNLKPYSESSNPDNQYIGTKINSYIHLGAYASVKISKRIDLWATFGLKHYSNGSVKKPNAGINFFPVSLGGNVRLGDIQPMPTAFPSIPKKTLKTYWNIALYSGMKSYGISSPAYYRGGVGVNYLLEPVYKYRFGLGLDMFWAPGMKWRYPGQSFTLKDRTSMAVVGSWEWQLTERIYIPIGLGVYLYRNILNQEITWFYERAGVRYRFGPGMFAGAQIKAHKLKADFFEFTIGYTICGK